MITALPCTINQSISHQRKRPSFSKTPTSSHPYCASAEEAALPTLSQSPWPTAFEAFAGSSVRLPFAHETHNQQNAPSISTAYRWSGPKRQRVPARSLDLPESELPRSMRLTHAVSRIKTNYRVTSGAWRLSNTVRDSRIPAWFSGSNKHRKS